jgi:hypothetical protein
MSFLDTKSFVNTILSRARSLTLSLSSGMGVLMLFFPDDLRDYFCDNTVRKCEKLSVISPPTPLCLNPSLCISVCDYMHVRVMCCMMCVVCVCVCVYVQLKNLCMYSYILCVCEREREREESVLLVCDA